MSGDLSDDVGDSPAPGRKIPRRIAQALEARLTGRVTTWKAAAELADITPEHLSRMLAKDHVRAFYDRRAGEILRDLRPEAIATLRDLMVNGKSERTRLTATGQAFRLLGMYPRDGQVVQVNVQPGYVIDLSGGAGSSARVIDGQLIEPPTDGANDADDGGDR